MTTAVGAKGRRPWPIVLAVVVLAAVVAVAWVLQAAVSGDGSSAAGAAKPYSIQVLKDGAALKTYDLAALRTLPQSQVVIDGKEQTGPSLRALLADAGAGGYTSVDVRGAGLRDKGRLTLTEAEVGRKVQLDFSDRGTVKVCGPDLYHADWVRDVVSIDAH
jgi:hypothetical protein